MIEADNTVVEFPNVKPTRKLSSTEEIWGKAVIGHGYAGIPSMLIRSQGRLNLSPMQFNIIIQLSEYWFDPSRPPLPTKQDIANRMGASVKAIQLNIATLQKAGLIRREFRRTAVGDYDSNIYHLDGLIAKVRALEPDFAREKAARRAARQAREDAQLSPLRRRSKAKD
ncbi:helix-turn-helix domain-containing protein [Acetobacter sacchari]|uniref:Helix-turn-helix domain-containing protein n=1 Tax=Acetobacter sacchari TaxID=2661687 RepID=A0ABS3LWB0_9PROT|nr:helix-turn-helix domain-containing protein [Acetobacter sacchari]MBO1360192.1 helix-turn-helix domain-containing protein [Acetobacter sacchari]